MSFEKLDTFKLDFKFSASIVGFIFFCLGILFLSKMVERDEYFENENKKNLTNELQDSFFTQPIIYKLKGREKDFVLNASEMTITDNQNKFIFFDPIGSIFTTAGDEVLYKGKRGLYTQNNENLILEEDVEFTKPDSIIVGDRLNYMFPIDFVLATGNVMTNSWDLKTKDNVIVHSEELRAYPKAGRSEYRGNVVGKLKRKRPYEDGVDFWTDQLFANRDDSKLTLIGNVKLIKQGLTALSREGEIFMDNYNKKLKYYTLIDDVKLTEKVKLEDGSSFIRTAVAEKLDGLVAEEKNILTGFPKVFQQGDVITGNRITIRENNQVVEVDDANTDFILK